LLLYLESVRDAGSLAELGAIAAERDLPVIALKAGRTAAGAVAARSHTGALANEDRVVDAFLEKHGICRAHDCDDLVRSARLHLSGIKSRGRKVVVVSNSGTSCVQSADALTDAGLEVGALDPSTQKALLELLPAFATAANPVDLTAGLLGNSSTFSEVLPVLGADVSADAFLIALQAVGTGYDLGKMAADTGAFLRDSRWPVAAATSQPVLAALLAEEGIPSVPTEAGAVAMLAQFVGAAERRAAARARRPETSASVPIDGNVQVLNEVQALALVARAGVPVVAHRLCEERTRRWPPTPSWVVQWS
jgi:acyl-CoA synthetase (NDP forming)